MVKLKKELLKAATPAPIWAILAAGRRTLEQQRGALRRRPLVRQWKDELQAAESHPKTEESLDVRGLANRLPNSGGVRLNIGAVARQGIVTVASESLWVGLLADSHPFNWTASTTSIFVLQRSVGR
jgi:hypothetical protein